MDEQASQSRLHRSMTYQPHGAQSNSGLPQQRRFDESWVEVASQPSSSSLSSIGDEIITTGLRVAPGPYSTRRRRQTVHARSSLPQQQTALRSSQNAGGAGSSQEEYDESESDEDHLMGSSAEHLQQSPSEDACEDSDAESDDGDDATALGLGKATDRPSFRPQPNAFNHPGLAHRSHSTSSAVPPHPHSGFTRPSFSQRSQTRVHRGGPSFMSPAVQEDNDAALRASLTTLLSCAAAARGLPKSRDESAPRSGAPTLNGVGPSNQPMELRLVPESDLMAEPSRASSADNKGDSSSRASTRAHATADKPKRTASTGRSPRATKKKKTAQASDEAVISPTLLTWVVSAGFVVIVSVVGFGAGYVMGREAGRQEILAASTVNDTSSCSREVMRTSTGLRRLRWGDVGKSIVASS